MANLRIEGKRIEQDRVEILGNCLKGKDAKRWVDEYIEFIFECWKNGFSEKTYNFTINHGVALNRKIVLVDFGELNFTKSKIKGEINSMKNKVSLLMILIALLFCITTKSKFHVKASFIAPAFGDISA